MAPRIRAGNQACRNAGPQAGFPAMHTKWLLMQAHTALCLAVSLLASAAYGEEPLDVRLEASATYDSNITRSRGSENVLSDVIYNLNASKSHVVPLTENARLSLLGTAGLEGFHRYTRLSRLFLGLEAEVQYRPSAEFSAPTLGLFGRAAADFYNSRMRDGYRYSFGARILQPLTDRIDLFGAIAHNVRNARSTVFDDKDNSVRVNLDYSVSEKGTLYLNGEYRRGQIVSTSLSDPGATVVEAEERDDAFTNPDRTAYRLTAKTGIATVGYSHGLAADRSLDFSIRWVRSTVLPVAGSTLAETIRYYDTQATLAYLVRF
jgi:hypothetical protein